MKSLERFGLREQRRHRLRIRRQESLFTEFWALGVIIIIELLMLTVVVITIFGMSAVMFTNTKQKRKEVIAFHSQNISYFFKGERNYPNKTARTHTQQSGAECNFPL